MDAAELKARYAEAKARSRETLERTAEIKVEYRDHRDDGLLTDHSINMPKKPPPPTIEEVRKEIADAMAELPRGLTAGEIEALVGREIGAYHKSDEMRPVTDVVIQGIGIAILNKLAREAAEIDKVREQLGQLRADLEIAKAHRPAAEEFFYLDGNGNKQDAELHGPILRAVDNPIDEKIMGPIRQRNRAKWLAQQKARRA